MERRDFITGLLVTVAYFVTDKPVKSMDVVKTTEKLSKKISLTDAHRAMIDPWHKKWVDIAMRTAPQTQEDRDIMVQAVNGLYRAANLDEPRYILFAPSPISGQVVAGVLYYVMTNKTPVNLNIQTTNTITQAIIKVLEPILTKENLIQNTENPVVIDETKLNWGNQFVKAAFPNFTAEQVTEVSNEVQVALNTYSGGNMWSAEGVEFITFFRHVVKLEIDYSQWDHYEKASIHAGFRYMYPDLCVVCDFPSQIKLDANNVAHNATGPSHVWRDGYEIYNWHGTLIPPEYHWIINNPEKLNKKRIQIETDRDMRKVMKEIVNV